MAPRVKLGSLDKMASSVRDKKAAAGPKSALGAVGGSRASLSKKFTQDSTSSSGSSDESSASDSGSDDDDLDAARKRLNAKMASKKPSNTKVNGTKPQTKAAQGPMKAEAKAKPESGSESESESEAEPTSAPNNKTVAPKTNAPAKTAAAGESDTTSDTTSDSEESTSDSEEEEKTTTKVNVPSQNISKTQKGGAAESESDESTASSGDESDEQGDKGVNGQAGDIAKTNGPAQLARPNWLNSSDFTLRKASSENPGKEVADFFSKNNLEGKQVWYFTAPSSLPITVIKEMEVDLSKATAGSPILNHQGDNYGLDFEANASNTQIQLLIPSKGGDKYTSSNHAIDSTIHLRRMAKFGPEGTVTSTASDQFAPQPRPIREQPQGLRARFTPIGVPTPQVTKPSSLATCTQSTARPTKDASESDEEMADAPPTSSIPTPSKKSAAGITNSKLKRKQAVGEPKVQPAPATEPISSEPSSKKRKSAKPAPGANATKAPASAPKGASKSKVSSSQASKSAGVKKETPIVAPNVALMASSFTSTTSASPKPASTPKPTEKNDKKKKEKGKKDTTIRSSPTEVKRTPIPPPSIPGMRP